MKAQIAAIAKALVLVEQGLKDDIRVAAMADAAGYSLYHFCRVFNAIVHHTPYDYLMRRRLSESALCLLETNWNVADIAFEYQFNSHEAYSRAFKRVFGMPPQRYRTLARGARRAPERRLWLPPLTVEYLCHINKGARLRADLDKKDALHLVG